MKKVIFILGTGHCGSTLLDLILGSHSEMFSLGEVYRLVSSNPTYPLCDICAENCEFWKPELLMNLKSSYSYSMKNRLGRKFGLVKKPEVLFYQNLSKATQKNILIDSSKNSGWISRNGKALKASGIDPVLIYLSRDGRAVINSYYRKYPERGLEGISQNWNARIQKINSCFESWLTDSKIHIRYEDLAKSPIETIQELMNFLKLPFEEEMMRFWEHEHHPVNGNAGTKSMLLKYKDKKRHNEWVDEHGKDYYREKELGIKFDQRWKQELSEKEISIVEDITGFLNASLLERNCE